MPQIVLSVDKTTWVGKALYSGEQYISFDDYRFNVNSSDIILEPDQQQITADIERLFNITIYSTINLEIYKMLARQLCNPNHTNGQCLYFSNYKATFGISKCLDNNVKL